MDTFNLSLRKFRIYPFFILLCLLPHGRLALSSSGHYKILQSSGRFGRLAHKFINGWGDDVWRLPDYDDKTFRELVWPLADICANSYRYPAEVAVPGWQVSSRVPALAPVIGGAHAVLYEERDFEEGGRLILAFRGTQLGSIPDGQADYCADVLLWGEEGDALPDYCKQFSNETLDYYTQAVKFGKEVSQAYPKASVLLTGHSLGAGLALLLAATPNVFSGTTPTVIFSPAGAKRALSIRNLHLPPPEQRMVFGIADRWDAVVQSSLRRQVPSLCLYPTDEPAACVNCFKKTMSEVSAQSALRVRRLEHWPGRGSRALKAFSPHQACFECFMETHILKHVMSLILDWHRPNCTFSGV